MSGVSRSVKNGHCWAFLRRTRVKVGDKYSLDVLSQQMLPAIRHVAGDNFVFQQDSSPAHRPVDYKIWGIMQQPVYELQIHNVDELKRRLVDVWSGLQQSVVDAAVSE